MSHTRAALSRQKSPVSLALAALIAWIILGGLLGQTEPPERPPETMQEGSDE